MVAVRCGSSRVAAAFQQVEQVSEQVVVAVVEPVDEQDARQAVRQERGAERTDPQVVSDPLGAAAHQVCGSGGGAAGVPGSAVQVFQVEVVDLRERIVVVEAGAERAAAVDGPPQHPS